VELHQLQCFMAVVEEGGFNRATTRLHMTQPAISYQIKLLEAELGMPLFYRRSRGISPTEAGRVLFQHARRIEEMVRQAQQALERLSDGVAGEVRIGTVNSVGIYFLPDVLHTMRAKYPSARPTVLYRNSYEIIDALLSNRVDLALVANPQPDRRLRQETVLEEQVSLVFSRSHPFFGRDTIRPAELTGQPLTTLRDVVEAARSLNDAGVRAVLVSLGADGAVLVESDLALHAWSDPVAPRSNVGAGDATLAGFLAGGGTGADALRLAVAFGTAAVQLPGSAMPGPDQIHKELIHVSDVDLDRGLRQGGGTS